MTRALLIVCALAGLAAADKGGKADAAFARGKKLLGEKRYQEACAAFEESDQLDPGIGAKMNTARCYEEWGRIGTAWRWYHDAQTMAEGAKDERSVKIRALADALDANVPRLMIKLPPNADLAKVAVTLDGTPVALKVLGIEQRIDPGPHEIEFTGADGTKKRKVVPLERGGSSEVTLDVPRAAPGAVADAGKVAIGDGASARVGRTQRLGGIALGGASVVAIGIAGIATLRARSDYKHALGAHCSGAPDMCDDTGITDTHSARHRANIATVVTILGGAAIAGGVVLYLTAPHGHAGAPASEHALYLAPSASPESASMILGGRF